MADAAQIVEGMVADIVDVNMGCPVSKIAKHNAGCSLMREPRTPRRSINAMAKAVKIPVTVKMRAGWNDRERKRARLARMVRTPARRRSRFTAGPRAVLHRLGRLGSRGARRRTHCRFRCLAAATASSRSRSSTALRSACWGVLTGAARRP
jgi:hypothetical protein